MKFGKIFVYIASIVLAGNAYAGKVQGEFTAIKSCPAYQSFTKGHNPGDVTTQPESIYEILEENKLDGAWILLNIPEETINRRWVAKECGKVVISARTPNSDKQNPESDDAPNSNECSTKNKFDSYVLALSWQAGFCEHYSNAANKPECINLNSGRISVSNITIHGLWPNKASCGTSYGNCGAPPLKLEQDTVSALAPWMPNWYYSDDFGEHEWNKHGSCQALDDDEYFLLVRKLAEKFDSSVLGAYMRNYSAQKVKVTEFYQFLVKNLGEDVASKIELRCTGKNRQFVNEFWINLPQTINSNGSLSTLVTGAKNKPKFSGNCPAEIYIEHPGPN